MFQYHCLNPIAEKGLGLFDEEYKKSEDLQGVRCSPCKKCKKCMTWSFLRA